MANSQFGLDISSGKGTRRVTSDSKTGKQMMSQNKNYLGKSNNTPHSGAKEIHKGHKRKGIAIEECPYCIKEYTQK